MAMISRKAKGASQLDWVIALTVFFFFVTLIFFVATQGSSPEAPFREPLRKESQRIAEELTDAMSTTIYRVPIRMTSQATSNRAFELYFVPDEDVDLDSIGLLDADEVEVPFEYVASENKIVWTADVSTGTNTFWLSYSKGTNLTALAYTSDITSDDEYLNTTVISSRYGNNGLTSIIFGSTEFVDQTYGIDLPITQAFTITNGTVKGKVTYTDGTNVVTYNGSSILQVSDLQLAGVVINVIGTAATSFYDGDVVHSFNATHYGEDAPYSKTVDVIDLYTASSGMTILGDNMEIVIYNYNDVGYRRVNITNNVDFEIYMHSGTYTNALTEQTMFLNPPSAFLGATKEVKGLYQSDFYNISTMDYDTLKNTLGVEGVEFRMTLEE